MKENDIRTLEELTLNAFQSLLNSLQFKNIKNIESTLDTYSLLGQKLEQHLGQEFYSEKTTDKTEQLDRYLLQYIVGKNISKVLELRYKGIFSLMPKGTPRIQTLPETLEYLNDKTDPARYRTIGNISRFLTDIKKYDLLLELLQYIQKNYEAPNKIERQQKLNKQNESLQNWKKANRDFFKYFKK